MKYSNKLDLNIFFSKLESKNYVIIKLTDFPNYYSGSDIDIFCYNVDEIAREIIFLGKQYLEDGFEIVAKNANDSHKYIDFIFDNKIEFRFDLYGELPVYKKVCIQKNYFPHIINNCVPVAINSKLGQYNFYVPSQIDELILRYIEYIEWYEIRPDKIKHLDYIMDAIDDDSEKMIFLDKLHQFTALPTCSDNINEERDYDKYSYFSKFKMIMKSPCKLFRKFGSIVKRGLSK